MTDWRKRPKLVPRAATDFVWQLNMSHLKVTKYLSQSKPCIYVLKY